MQKFDSPTQKKKKQKPNKNKPKMAPKQLAVNF